MKIYTKINKHLLDLGSKSANILKILNRLDKKIILVTDKKRLVGTITDGDVRKNFYSSNSELTIKNVVNKKPSYLYQNYSNRKISSIDKKKIRFVPIIDKSKKIIGLIDLWSSNFLDKSNEVVIFAGGLGKRLRPYTKSIPKPMLKINKKPHLENLIKKIFKQGFENITILLFYKYRYILKKLRKNIKGKKIKFIIEKKPLGTAGGLKNIKLKNDKPILVLNADLITSLDLKNLLYYHNASSSDLTVSVKQKIDRLAYATVNLKQNKILSLEEKPQRNYYFNAGIYIIEKKLIKLLKKNEKLDMPELIEKSIKKNFKVRAFNVYEEWIDYGSKEVYEKLKGKNDNY